MPRFLACIFHTENPVALLHCQLKRWMSCFWWYNVAIMNSKYTQYIYLFWVLISLFSVFTELLVLKICLLAWKQSWYFFSAGFGWTKFLVKSKFSDNLTPWVKSKNKQTKKFKTLKLIREHPLCFDNDVESYILKLTLCSPALSKKNGMNFFTEMTGNPSLRIRAARVHR